MSKIIMQTLSAGPKGVVSPGDKVSVSKEYGAELVNGGFGHYEKAVIKAPEKREAPADFSKMKKASLLQHAQQRGIAVPKKATNKHIIELLEG